MSSPPQQSRDVGRTTLSATAHTALRAWAAREWLATYRWVLVATAAALVSGMAYSFWWPSVFYHSSQWLTPPDIWSTLRDAHYVGWGSEGQVYAGGTSFVTFPGIAVLLSPVAVLQGALHLTESYPLYLPQPSAWYILGPVDILCGAVVLFPLDALARRLGATKSRRIALTWLEAVLVWPCVVFWGHPEDPLALAFMLGALLAAHERSWFRTGAYLALAIVFQPLTLLVTPLALALVPWRRWLPLAGIAALPSLLLLLAPLIQQWRATTTALLKQPNYPLLNHPTPWLTLAPVISRPHWITLNELRVTTLADGKKVIAAVPTRVMTGLIVASGPGRAITLVGACAIGWWAYKKRPSLIAVMWLGSLALALRCVFETVLDPYYFYPALALALLAGTRASWRRFIAIVISAALCTRCTYTHYGEWPYYLCTMGTLAMTLAFAFPWHDTGREDRVPNTVDAVAEGSDVVTSP